jgi:hypothetical protein
MSRYSSVVEAFLVSYREDKLTSPLKRKAVE